MEAINENVYVLNKPFQFEGDTITELNLDLDSLTGKDLIGIDRRMPAKEFVAMKELDKTYLSFVAAEAAKVPVELIHALPAKDFSKVTLRVQNFLLS